MFSSCRFPFTSSLPVLTFILLLLSTTIQFANGYYVAQYNGPAVCPPQFMFPHPCCCPIGTLVGYLYGRPWCAPMGPVPSFMQSQNLAPMPTYPCFPQGPPPQWLVRQPQFPFSGMPNQQQMPLPMPNQQQMPMPNQQQMPMPNQQQILPQSGFIPPAASQPQSLPMQPNQSMNQTVLGQTSPPVTKIVDQQLLSDNNSPALPLSNFTTSSSLFSSSLTYSSPSPLRASLPRLTSPAPRSSTSTPAPSSSYASSTSSPSLPILTSARTPLASTAFQTSSITSLSPVPTSSESMTPNMKLIISSSQLPQTESTNGTNQAQLSSVIQEMEEEELEDFGK